MTDNRTTDIRIEAKHELLRSLASNVSPITAVSGLIWNGFNVNAQHVQAILEPNESRGLHYSLGGGLRGSSRLPSAPRGERRRSHLYPSPYQCLTTCNGPMKRDQ